MRCAATAGSTLARSVTRASRTQTTGPADSTACPTRSYVLDIVIPVYNEERDLPGSVRRLHEYLAAEVPYPSRITIADNASTDSTLAVAQSLAQELPDVEVIHLDPHAVELAP